MMWCADRAAVVAGFQSTVLPIRAGEVERLPPMDAEVERADREHEPLERPVLEPVPGSLSRDRLLLVDAEHVLDVEAPEVDQLARRVDLRLVSRFRLVEHGGGVDGRPPRAREQLRGTEEDGRSLLPGRARPVVPGLARRRNRLLDVVRTALRDVGQDVVAVVRHHRLERVVGDDVLAADDQRDPWALTGHRLQAGLQLGALGAARRIGANRLVDRGRRPENPERAHGASVDGSRVGEGFGECAGDRRRPRFHRLIAEPPGDIAGQRNVTLRRIGRAMSATSIRRATLRSPACCVCRARCSSIYSVTATTTTVPSSCC